MTNLGKKIDPKNKLFYAKKKKEKEANSIGWNKYQ